MSDDVADTLRSIRFDLEDEADKDAIIYALRAIEERRELLDIARAHAALLCICGADYGFIEVCSRCVARALIPKCEAP